MAVKALNDSAGPDGLVPTLLVFGTFPRISNCDPPTAFITERSKAIKMAMAEISGMNAKRKITEALQQRNGPQTLKIHDTKIGSDVLVWRQSVKRWKGPFKLLAIHGKTCIIQAPQGPVNFRSINVKPYFQETSDKNTSSNENVLLSPIDHYQPNDKNDSHSKRNMSVLRRNPTIQRQVPARFRDNADITILISSSNIFDESRRNELDELLERGVFKIVDKNSIPIGTRIFGSRFVDQIKNEGTSKAYEKSRLVAQVFKDTDKKYILTQAPTIQRISQHIILAIAMMRQELSIYLRDITQAYTQSKTKLQRDIYIRAPVEMDLNEDTILKVVLPLYGVPEAGTHWFRTYHSHHVQKLNMIPSPSDPCLLYNEDGTGIIGLQTDDSLIVANDEFIKTENKELHNAKLVAKLCELLTRNHPLSFNGFLISLVENNITITQESQIKKIDILTDNFSKEQYISQRARGAYIATVSQQQAVFALSIAAQTKNPGIEDMKNLNKILLWQQKSIGLTYVKLDLKSLRIISFTDSSFAKNADYSSQIVLEYQSKRHKNQSRIHTRIVRIMIYKNCT